MPTALHVPLNQRVEFLSEEWFAAARGFLSGRSDNLGSDVSYGECFVYSDPPAHLTADRGGAGYTLRIRDGQIDLTPGESDDVDYKEMADYNQALALACTVVDGRGDRWTRARREFDHRYGPDARSTKGVRPSDGALRALLDEMHDHLARRTVPNPDLDQRIGALGLATQRDSLDEVGYAIVESAITEDFADEIKAALNAKIDETSGAGSHGLNSGSDGSAGRLLERDQIFEATAQHPVALALAEHVVGKGCLLSTILGFRKAAGDDTHIVHVDYPLVHEPYPDLSLAATTIWALEDFTEESGPTLVVPGSYKRNREPRAGEGDGELVPIIMPKGSIAIWRGNTWHSARVRTAPGFRTTLHQTYCRLYTRSVDGYMDVDPAILARNPPVMATLCGLDDLFEKGTAEGPYKDGVIYARKYFLSQRGGSARPQSMSTS